MDQEVKTVLDGIESTVLAEQKNTAEKIEKYGAESAEVKQRQEQVVADLTAQAAKYDELEKEQKQLSAALARQAVVEEKGEKPFTDERKALHSYIQRGIEGKSLIVSNDPQAGYAVVPEMGQMFDSSITEFSPFRQVAGQVTLTKSDAWETLVNKKGGVGAAWEGETEYNSNTGAPSLGTVRIPTDWTRASVFASEQMLMDASLVNMESWIMGEAAENFATLENAAFFSGNGVAKPKGILTYDSGSAYNQVEQVASGSSGAFTTTGLLKLVGSQKAAYQAGSVFMAKRATIFTNLFGLKDGENRHYLVPDFSKGFQFRLLGFPLLEATDMPAVAADALALAFGNFNRGYQIVDRNGMTVMRDPYSNKPYIEFWFRKRVGGGLKIGEAIKLQKLEA